MNIIITQELVILFDTTGFYESRNGWIFLENLEKESEILENATKELIKLLYG